MNTTLGGWRCGSKGRMAALQVQGPQFKLQSYQEKKNQNEKA
jgi:hypothetical protein